MTLRAQLVVRRDAFALEAELHVGAGEVVAVLGPNGAGKTTALRALAGLTPLDAGTVELDGALLDAPGQGVFAPPERRSVGVVFQDYLLFPHLSAVDNVAFGLRARGVGRSAAHGVAERWLDRVGLAGHGRARPRQLSGGQAQRVALARALAPQPRLLLLDEPLAALDAGTRAGIRSELRRHLSAYDGCAVLVTHDPLDAMVLADRLVVLEAGRVVQEGPPAEVGRAPRTEYVARLVGLNLYRGAGSGTRVVLREGGEVTVAAPAHGDVFVAFPPSAVALYRVRPEGSPRNAWPVRVAGIEAHGGTVRVLLDGAPAVAADVTPAAVAELGLVPGVQAWAAVKASETRVYPA